MESVTSEIVYNSAKIIAAALADMKTIGTLPTQSWNCKNAGSSNDTRIAFNKAVETAAARDSTYIFKVDKHEVPILTAPVKIDITRKNSSDGVTDIGEWSPERLFQQSPTYTQKKIKRFFRVGEE